MAKKKRKLFGIEIESEGLFWGIIVVIGIILYKVVWPMINSALRSLNISGASGDAGSLVKQNNPSNPASDVRTQFVAGVVDTLQSRFNAILYSEPAIVSDLNSLANANEVAFACSYFNKQYGGKSLKAEVTKRLSSWANPIGWLTDSHWSDLKDYVQKNLV